jgi:NAD(P)H-dependent flavin oxidoreductase YrpB (nitropropane dioxygenase family)
MKAWPDRRILDLFGIDLPIILAPMAGPGTAELAIAVSEAGGLGAVPCGQLSITEIRAALETIHRSTLGYEQSVCGNVIGESAPWSEAKNRSSPSRLVNRQGTSNAEVVSDEDK